MKVFSVDKFVNSLSNGLCRQVIRELIEDHDGDAVINGRLYGYKITAQWCIDISDQPKEGKKMWTMKDFKTKPIAVLVGKHMREFLQICEDEGLRWANGDKATEFVPYKLYDNTVITMNGKYNKGNLTYCTADKAITFGNLTIVAFDDFAGRPPMYRIVIESDGKDTKAVMEVNGRQVKDATAKLHPKDEFNWRTGAETAFVRLWEKKGEDGQSEPSKPSVKEIKKALKAAKDICTGSHCVDCPLSVGGGWCFCDYDDTMFPENWRTRWEGDANEQGRKDED